MTDAVVHAVTKRRKRHLHVVFLTHFKCEQNWFLKSQPRVLEMITFIYLFISSSTIKIQVNETFWRSCVSHARGGWMTAALVKSDLLLMNHKEFWLWQRNESLAKQSKCVSPDSLGRHNWLKKNSSETERFQNHEFLIHNSKGKGKVRIQERLVEMQASIMRSLFSMNWCI